MRIQGYDRSVTEPASAGMVQVTGAGTADLGAAKGLATLQAAAEELTVRSQEAARQVDVMSRTTAFRTGYSSWFAQRSQSASEWRTLAAESDHALNTLAEHAVAGIDDPYAKAAIQDHVIQFAGTAAVEARKTAISQQVDWSKAALEDHVFMSRQEVAQAPNDVEKQRLMRDTQNVIHAAAAAGYISPLDAEKKVKAYVDGVYEDQLQSAVYNDPDGVLRAMADDKYPGLSEDSRQRIIVNAEKRSEAMRAQRIADDNRKDAHNEKVLKRAQGVNAGRMSVWALNGVDEQGRPFGRGDAVDALDRGQIDGKQFKQIIDVMHANELKGGPGNYGLTQSLRLRAYVGELPVGEILAAADGSKQGAIDRNETDELLKLVQEGSAFTNTDEYKQATEFMKRSYGISGMFMSDDRMKSTSTVQAAMDLRELYVRVRSQGDNVSPLNLATEILARHPRIFPQGVSSRYKTKEEAKAAYNAGILKDGEYNDAIDQINLAQPLKPGAK